MPYLLRQVFVYHVIKPVLGQGLLFRTDAHLYHLLEGLLPLLVVEYEGVVLQGVLGTLDVHLLQGMGGELVIYDVLRGNAQIPCGGDTEIFIYMGGVPGAYLEGTVYVANTVGVAVHKGIDRYLLLFGEPSDKATAGPGGHSTHGDQYTVGLLPVGMFGQSLEHTGRLYCQDEFGVRLKLQVLYRYRYRVGP